MGALRVAALLGLAACAPATTREGFLAGFTPSAHVIHKYERIKRAPYAARVGTRGVEAVQRAVNAVDYRADGPESAWHPPSRFWERGGDCEEFALTKGAELAAQGYEHLYLTVVYGRRTGAPHAILAVEDNGVMVALDIIEPRVMPWAEALDLYRPAYAIDLVSGKVLVAQGIAGSRRIGASKANILNRQEELN